MPTTPSPPQPPVIIIGGGLAGLALAQALKKSHIPFRIFERDTNAAFRAQGYRIRIGPDGALALQQLLPAHLWKVYEETCARVVHGGHRIDARTGGGVEWARGPPPTKPPLGAGARDGKGEGEGKAYNADRAVLRSVLLSGLEGEIEFGKKFVRYEIDGDGEVIAHFADGTLERGTFLVGADGVRSVVRRQLLPGMELLDTEGRAVFGKTVVTEELVSKMAGQIGDGIALIAEEQESRMKLFTDGMKWDRTLASTSAGGLGIDLPDDYIYWVLVFRNDVASATEEDSLLSLSNDESAQMAIDLTATWNGKVRVLLDLQKRDAASTLAFLTSPMGFEFEWATKPRETRSRVTLVGDSAHPMPPVGGIGANAGFQDSADLVDALIQMKGIEDEAAHEQLIDHFEQTMLARSKTAVERISIGAGHFFGMRPLAELKPAVIWH